MLLIRDILCFSSFESGDYVDLSSIAIPKSHLESVSKNLEYNEHIGKYYWRLFHEIVVDPEKTDIQSERVKGKVERLQSCNSIWQLDVYRKSKVKDFLKTNLCKDKFCNNCKKLKQAARQGRFMPEIEKYAHVYKMSHMVLTVPNIEDAAGDGEKLRNRIKTMFTAFSTLIEYLKEKKKIKGINFDYGYVGAIRSLEVTYKKNSYHPHLHVLIAHTDNFGEKINMNRYSYDKYGRKPVRAFSDFEIMIQKLWYLLITDTIEFENKSKEDNTRRKKITKKRLDDLEIGYSCMIDEFVDGDFHELFKYMTKSDGIDNKEDGESSIMTYLNFKTLFYSLHRVRQIQGYGVFFNISDDDSFMDEVAEEYERIINALREKEKPESASETVQALLEDNEYTIISKKQLYKIIKSNSNSL